MFFVGLQVQDMSKKYKGLYKKVIASLAMISIVSVGFVFSFMMQTTM